MPALSRRRLISTASLLTASAFVARPVWAAGQNQDNAKVKDKLMQLE